MFTNAAYKIILPIKGKDRNKYNYVDKNLKFSLSKKYGNLKYLFVLLVVITYPISIFIAVGYGIYWVY